jgi:hypothetical protein
MVKSSKISRCPSIKKAQKQNQWIVLEPLNLNPYSPQHSG